MLWTLQKIDTSKVSVLTTVRVFHIGLKKEIEYTLVTEKEADLKQTKFLLALNWQGPPGQKGRRRVEIQVPAGKLGMKILDIRI